MESNNFWFGKRVLVTGGDGFVATHLIYELLKKGAYVIATMRHKRPLSNLEILKKSEPHLQAPDMEYCDLLDFHDVRRICDRHQVDTIFHLAASAIVSDAANSPMSTIENNVMSTLNMLEVSRVNKIPRVMIASTDKAYGDHASDTLEGLPYKEHYSLRGLDVYSSSKVCTDMISQTYAFQFKLPVIIVRSCNIFGPGDFNFTRLIPKTIMSLLSDKAPVINQGNENVLREYIYIDDVVGAYMFLAEQTESYYGSDNINMPRSGKMTYGWNAFNVGSFTSESDKVPSDYDNIKSVQNVIDMLRAKVKDIDPVIIEKPANFIEIPNQYLDSSKINKLGFNTQVSFEQGIDKSIKWYSDNYEYLKKIAYKYINR